MKRKYLIGIDEVGRGPLAGPVAVGAVVATPRILRKFREIKESKQLSEKQREEWFTKITDSVGDELDFAVSFVSPHIIDTKGISYAIRLALSRSLKKLSVNPDECNVLLDGGLYAPKEYIHQKTIIRGDGTETAIAMASVLAKVLRDRMMVSEDVRYPQYGFRSHKGYGTKSHIEKIRKNGFTPIHRVTFCTKYHKSNVLQ